MSVGWFSAALSTPTGASDQEHRPGAQARRSVERAERLDSRIPRPFRETLAAGGLRQHALLPHRCIRKARCGHPDAARACAARRDAAAHPGSTFPGSRSAALLHRMEREFGPARRVCTTRRSPPPTRPTSPCQSIRWCRAEIFDEKYFPSVPFHGGFGLLNLHGVPMPLYRAFELLDDQGNCLYPVRGSQGRVDVWVSGGDGCVTVFMTNYAMPRHEMPLSRCGCGASVRDGRSRRCCRAPMKTTPTRGAPGRRWASHGLHE